jgi:dihydrofolate synthase/folylpolyglutamate synthase
MHDNTLKTSLPQDLTAWLAWQDSLHPHQIELGLARIAEVWSRLTDAPVAMPVITVGGTNGKGSCVTYLDAWYCEAGYRCGVYRSPHLQRYNERICIAGQEASDDQLCEAFTRVEQARGQISLTYFEFGTLAALDLFIRAAVDVIILEVGMGGRLDAVNILAADVAIVTTIGHDHMAWLGNDLAAIALEKAGIFRPERPAIIGQRQPPPELRTAATSLGAQVMQLGQEFDWQQQHQVWHWYGLNNASYRNLPYPKRLQGVHQLDNAATALCAAYSLKFQLPALTTRHIVTGLQTAFLPGRCQIDCGAPTWLFDVAHNREAFSALAAAVAAYPCHGVRHLVCALLDDKDPDSLATALQPLVTHWYPTTVTSPRAMASQTLTERLIASGVAVQQSYSDLEAALMAAYAAAQPADMILVTGSFITVESAFAILSKREVISADDKALSKQ